MTPKRGASSGEIRKAQREPLEVKYESTSSPGEQNLYRDFGLSLAFDLIGNISLQYVSK